MKTTKTVGTVKSFIACDELGRAIKAIENILTKLRGPDFGTSLISYNNINIKVNINFIH